MQDSRGASAQVVARVGQATTAAGPGNPRHQCPSGQPGRAALTSSRWKWDPPGIGGGPYPVPCPIGKGANAAPGQPAPPTSVGWHGQRRQMQVAWDWRTSLPGAQSWGPIALGGRQWWPRGHAMALRVQLRALQRALDHSTQVQQGLPSGLPAAFEWGHGWPDHRGRGAGWLAAMLCPRTRSPPDPQRLCVRHHSAFAGHHPPWNSWWSVVGASPDMHPNNTGEGHVGFGNQERFEAGRAVLGLHPPWLPNADGCNGRSQGSQWAHPTA